MGGWRGGGRLGGFFADGRRLRLFGRARRGGRLRRGRARLALSFPEKKNKKKTKNQKQIQSKFGSQNDASLFDDRFFSDPFQSNNDSSGPVLSLTAWREPVILNNGWREPVILNNGWREPVILGNDLSGPVLSITGSLQPVILNTGPLG